MEYYFSLSLSLSLSKLFNTSVATRAFLKRHENVFLAPIMESFEFFTKRPQKCSLSHGTEEEDMVICGGERNREETEKSGESHVFEISLSLFFCLRTIKFSRFFSQENLSSLSLSCA